MAGAVESIHIVRVKRGTPERIESALLRRGHGIPGDHHDKPGVKRPVTIIRAETIEEVAQQIGCAVTPGSSRRNITTRGIDLDSLPEGTILHIGGAKLKVQGPCDPCLRMEAAIGPGALVRMEHRGGIFARVVEDGVVWPGDPIRVEPK